MVVLEVELCCTNDGNIIAGCRLDFEDLEHPSHGFNLSLLLLAESYDMERKEEPPWLIGLVLICREFKFVREAVFRIEDESSIFNSIDVGRTHVIT
jgi:hypothetical protein